MLQKKLSQNDVWHNKSIELNRPAILGAVMLFTVIAFVIVYSIVYGIYSTFASNNTSVSSNSSAPVPEPQAISFFAPKKWKPNIDDKPTVDYIKRFAKIAKAEQERFGIPASISLAQGILESDNGNSSLAKKNNNHFGVKCFSHYCKKGHCSNFTDDSHKDFFRKYNSAWDSWRAHSIFISNGRYKKLKRYGKDYKKWAYGLKRLGYATEQFYAEMLIDKIEKYNLDFYDK